MCMSPVSWAMLVLLLQLLLPLVVLLQLMLVRLHMRVLLFLLLLLLASWPSFPFNLIHILVSQTYPPSSPWTVNPCPHGPWQLGLAV